MTREPSQKHARSLDGARVVVVGLGASGEAAARLARAKKADVLVTDARTRAQVGEETAKSLEKEQIGLFLGGHSGVDLLDADLVVVSPGVPRIPFLHDAERRGAHLVSEIELASWFVDADIIAVGGTNGKSTTTELAAALARTSGRAVFCGGNLGTPLASAVAANDPGIAAKGIAVVEVSSFQLERVFGFRPKASILLNVTPDHLDRYPSFEAYAVAKGRAFAAQMNDDVAIVPHGDSLCARLASHGGGRLEEVDGPDPASIGLDPHGDVVDRFTGTLLPRSRLHLVGRHNVTNLCAAWAAARAVGCDPKKFESAVDSFRGLPHRVQRVGEIGGVCYYDDSKGTNVDAAVTALLGADEAHVVLIAGGRDKGGSYRPLAEALEKKGRALISIGEAAPLIERDVRELAPSLTIERAATMDDAVALASKLAKSGDAVLLSPACSSFDMFRDYKHRGDVFAAAVQKLARGAP